MSPSVSVPAKKGALNAPRRRVVAAIIARNYPPDFAMSFVPNKGNKQWVWLAMHLKTWEIVGVHRGKRSEAGAKTLGQSLPGVYQQGAIYYTDLWAAYALVLPCKRQRALSKESGYTHRSERFNFTWRQRSSRLVR